jgi:hypothetical protein
MDDRKDELERAHRRVARGRSQATPFAALGGVMVVALGLAGVVVAIALVLWLVLR